jgi:hypothetical protein
VNKYFFLKYFRFICLCFNLLLCTVCGLCRVLAAEEKQEEDSENPTAKGVIVDLREPEYSDGVLKTTKGGVVTAPGMRLQARSIIYTRKVNENAPVSRIEAEGDLLIEFGEYIFIGSRLEYDFQSKQGLIYDGRTASEPWFFGGSLIYLEPDGSYKIEDAFVTTSENYDKGWRIKAREATLKESSILSAKQVQVSLPYIPDFSLPSFKTNLNSVFDSPLRYSFRWGGRQGPRASVIYELLSWQYLKTFVRLDWRLNRGLGLAVETYLKSEDGREELESINYIAHDSAIPTPHEGIRYRYQGDYRKLIDEDRLSLELTWDKLSDKYMATDYKDKGLELDTAGRTQLHLRLCKYAAITNFLTRVRINPFQTVKQELPSIETHFHPVNLYSTGVIFDNKVDVSYLDFQYADHLVNVHDYCSTRLEYSQKFYKHLKLGFFNVTPEIGTDVIFYGRSPQKRPRWLLLGKFGYEANTQLYRYYNCSKHVITPYMSYNYYTYPSTSPKEHYIFDINDGLFYLNMMCFGLRQSFYSKTEDCIGRFLFVDIYANTFFKTRTIPLSTPKLYANVVFNSLAFLRHSIDTAWDFEVHQLDHLNIRLDWTFSDDLALAAEYRHRDSFDWRKADHTNFILDSYRTIRELYHSQLSDRRDTFLLHLFYRFNPVWALEFSSRQGWNRRREPKYTEFEVDLLAKPESAWRLRFSYRYREDEKFRLGVNLSFGINKPDPKKYQCVIPYLEF